MSPADVIVAGGGSAGIAAALVAARAGARTLLLERGDRPGGMGSLAQVHTFCGLFHPDVTRAWAWLNSGLPEEFGRLMMARTGQTAPDLMGRVYVLRQSPAHFASLAAELCDREPNLTRLHGWEWSGLQRADMGWRLEVRDGRQKRSLETRALVDATGDATGARLANPAWLQPPPSCLYRPAYIGAFTQIGSPRDETWRLQLAAAMARGVGTGELPTAALGAAFRESPLTGEVFVTIDLEAGGSDWDPLDPARHDAALAEGRSVLDALGSWLRTHHPDFAQTPPPRHPDRLGVRESACYAGDYLLRGDELATCRRFPDEVALAGWPMERRETARGPKFRYFDRPEPAGIPAGCLRRADAPGLFFAGRCLSADHEALASVRVMGTCLATGQAAGRLAAAWAEAV
jgi:hypothetical protein